MEEKGKLVGTIKMFNGQFGFIKSDIGDIYFHKNSITHLDKIGVGDVISFYTEPSTIKKDSLQAKEIQITQKNNQPIPVKLNRYSENFGEIEWFNNKGFGLIKNKYGEYFFHISNVSSKSKLIVEGDVCIFNIIPSKRDRRKKDAVSVFVLKDYLVTQELANKIKREITGLKIINDNFNYKYLLKLLNIVKPIGQNGFIDSVEIALSYKISLWLENYIEEVDLDLVADSLLETTNSLYPKIFTRLKSETYQSQVLSIFSKKLGDIDSPQKYEKVKAIIGLKELTEQAKFDFLAFAFAKSDSERKFLFWSEKYVDEVDLETIANKMVSETYTSYSNIFQSYFIRLNIESQQSQVLSLFLTNLGNIDNPQKYEKVKAILGLREVPERTRKEFLSSAFAKSDSERKFLFWFEKYHEEVDIEAIADKMIGETPTSYSNPYQKFFARIKSEHIQSQVAYLFSSKLGNIDSPQKYENVKAILGLIELSEGTKNDLLSSAFEKSDNERKFLLWYEGFVYEFDIPYIIQGITENKFKYLSYDTLFSRLPENGVKAEIISHVFKQFSKIDDIAKYKEIKKILTIDNFDNIVDQEILNIIIQKSSFANKLRLSSDFKQYFDYDIKNVTEEALDCKDKISEISLLFDYVIESELLGFDKKNWFNNIIIGFGVSENLAFLNQISKILLIKPVKNKFAGVPLINLIGIKSPNEITYINDNLSLFPSEYYAQIKSFYYLFTSSGTYRSYSSWKHTKIYTDRILCIEHILKSEILSNETLLGYYQKIENIDFINELEYLRSFKELHLILGSEKKMSLFTHYLLLS